MVVIPAYHSLGRLTYSGSKSAESPLILPSSLTRRIHRLGVSAWGCTVPLLTDSENSQDSRSEEREKQLGTRVRPRRAGGGRRVVWIGVGANFAPEARQSVKANEEKQGTTELRKEVSKVRQGAWDRETRRIRRVIGVSNVADNESRNTGRYRGGG